MLNRYYLIINSDETNMIDFNQVRETSVDTLRYSLDGSKTFFKWDYQRRSILTR